MTEEPHAHIRLRHLRRHLRVGTLGWNINAALKLPRRRASSREGYLRDVAGAVQALQRMLPTSQSESAAPQPAPRATGILRLPPRGTPKARCGETPSVSPRGSRREMGRPQARPKAKPLLLPLLLPSPAPRSSPAGLGAAGRPQPSSSLRAGLASRSANQCQGEEFKPRRKGRGEQRRGHLPRPLPLGEKEKRKKITRGRGGKPEERRRQKEQGARRRRRCGGRRCGRALPRPLGSVSRRGFQSPASSHGATVCARSGARSPAGGRTDGRTHGLSAARRGAASPRRCSASSGGRGRRAGNAAASSACEAGRRARRGEALPPLPVSRPLPGSSFAAAVSSLPYPSGCHKPSALPSPRWETEEGRNPGPRVHQLGRGPRREARASPRAGGGAEVGNSQCDLGTRLQP